MTISFTEKINDSFFELNCNNDPFEAIEYLNNPENFRSFSAGLTELMIRCSYNGNPESLKEKKAYLSAALSNIGASVTSPTIKSWFIEGTHPRFNEHSRENMFLICFALNASLEDVNWFFSHVYFDRCFNYHDQDEAIYYYCFLHKLPYSHYQMIKNAISVYDSEIISDVSENMYTMKIRDKITNCASDNELISFLAKYKIVFEKFNLSATQQIQKYMYEIQNPKNGLAILEYQDYLESLYAEEKETQPYKYLQKGSVDFTLTIIFNGLVNVIKKNHDIPMIVRQNFPDKSVFSRLLSDVPKDTRYMMRRKTLILLYFYYFFAKIKLGQLDISEGEQADSFMEQLNEILESCGYDELFAGNPYDWLYMWAAYSDDPLTSFRDAIAYCDVEDGESS